MSTTTTTTKFTIHEIATAAATVLGVYLPDMVEDTSRRATENRYLTFKLMEQAGFTHQQIADYFKWHRQNVTTAINKLEGWLTTYKDMAGNYQRMVNLILHL